MILLAGPRDLPPFRRLIIPFLFVVALFATLYLRRVEAPFITLEVRGEAMGTSYLIKVVTAGDAKTDQKRLLAEVGGAIAAVNESMSTYIDRSELSRFNAATSLKPTAVSLPLYTVVGAALEISRLSEGAFDPTVGPLVNAWGFGPTKRNGVPGTEERLAALKRVGYTKLVLGASERTIQKRQADLYVDLSAIAKGYAVDSVAERLDKMGFGDYLVEIGGEVRTKGLNHRRRPWRLAIERPSGGNGEIHKNALVDLGTGAMATSGDYRNYYIENGKRVSHTIDPRTGQPIDHALASVTVLHESCMRADGWATALSVLGPEEGMAVARRLGLKVFMLVREANGQFAERTTQEFDVYRAKQPGVDAVKSDKSKAAKETKP